MSLELADLDLAWLDAIDAAEDRLVFGNERRGGELECVSM